MEYFRFQLISSILLAVLTVLVVADNATSATTSTSSTSTQSASLTDTTDSFWFPLVGLSDTASVVWGANVSMLGRSRVTGDVDPNWKAFEIAVNNTNPVPPDAIENPRTPLVIVNSDDTIMRRGSLVITTNGDPTIVLGSNSALNLTGAGLPVELIIPTVPFGVNFGHINIWNGSVTLGGRYDASRINSTSWTLVPESASGNSTFLKDGTQKTNVTLTFRGHSESFPAILDINHDAIILPSSFNCSYNVIESLVVRINSPNTSDPMLNVVIPSNLTASTDRCIQLQENDPNNHKVILGRPFFQATYAYVDKEGQVYLAAAHQYDLGIDAQPFNPTATMTPAASPPPPPSPTPTKNAAGSLKITDTLPSTGLCLAILTLVVSMTVMIV
jgi:hypothetical protein